MRLICSIPTTQSKENPYEFSYYLTSEGIENEAEEVSSEGETLVRIWVIDEDLFPKAQELYAQYSHDPHNPQFHSPLKKSKESGILGEKREELPPVRRRGLLSLAPYGPISILVLITVIGLFVWAQMQRGALMAPKIPGVVQAPVLAPVERILLYDYPLYFQIRDHLLKIYTPEAIKQKTPPSAEARTLLTQLQHTPVWMGAYAQVTSHFQTPAAPLRYSGLLFEKIGQGEVWRVLTPAFLHFDLLHIFFNVLWFILLGNQIEFRLGKWRYLSLIILAAAVSNTAQYLMSGPFFMGLSGIVCAMAAFIWARQQVAPWEGYLLHRFTLIFLAIFVVGMFVLQTIFFFLQLSGTFELVISIANTAHLTGALVGYLLGRTRFFAIHPQQK